MHLAEKIENLNLNKADLIVCVSDVLKENLIERGVESKKILVHIFKTHAPNTPCTVFYLKTL